jgi:predicted dehydrogenase
MANPLRVGVIGLGPLWRKRYGPALRALPEYFAVRGVYDQVQERAVREAGRLGCTTAVGATALMEADIDAVLLLDKQWFGLWPLEAACRFGKPVYCCGSLEAEGPRADALVQKVCDSRVPVMVEMAPRFAPATQRLRGLLQDELGPARLVLCEISQPLPQDRGRDGITTPTPYLRPCVAPSPLGTEGIALVDWCSSLLGGEPGSALASGVEGAGLATLLLDFGSGRAVHLSRHDEPGTRPSQRLKVIAERGFAVVELPGLVRWTGPEGRFVYAVRGRRPVGQILLERFYQAVTAGQWPEPNLEDAFRILGWLRAAARSRDAVHNIPLGSFRA